MLVDLKLYLTCFLTILLIDYIWLALIMKSFYIEKLRPIGLITGDTLQPVYWAAFAVYAVLSVGIVQFALPKLSLDTAWMTVFGTGALLGFIIYGTYDFTNHSTLKDWPLSLTLIDLAWGSFLCGLVTTVARYVRDL